MAEINKPAKVELLNYVCTKEANLQTYYDYVVIFMDNYKENWLDSIRVEETYKNSQYSTCKEQVQKVPDELQNYAWIHVRNVKVLDCIE